MKHPKANFDAWNIQGRVCIMLMTWCSWNYIHEYMHDIISIMLKWLIQYSTVRSSRKSFVKRLILHMTPSMRCSFQDWCSCFERRPYELLDLVHRCFSLLSSSAKWNSTFKQTMSSASDPYRPVGWIWTCCTKFWAGHLLSRCFISLKERTHSHQRPPLQDCQGIGQYWNRGYRPPHRR
jgi:hypothetical protein